MKKILATIILSFFSLSMFAQWGSITISSQNFNQRFWVFVDDVLQNQYSVNSIRVQGMNIQQQYRVRIEMDNFDQNILGQNISINAQPRFNNYEIKFINGAYLFKSTNMNINPMLTMSIIYPNYSYYNDYYSYLNPGFGNYGNYWGNSGKKYNNQTIPSDCHPNNGNNYPGGNNYGNQGNNGNYGNPGNNGNNGNYGNNNNQGNHGNNGNNGNHGNNGNNGHQGNNTPCMSNNEFNTALNSIRSDSFESGKLTKAKQIVSRNRMCTAQIVQIVRLFSFESNKLEFAKYAYQFCNDKNNYYQVTDAFSFQSSKDELMKFIN
ncbi:MAG: hypothetical protein H6Q25_607 [Bacteroidetes bacterium]|nr:hypothetical protein [Bacteroidota bacterium]